uniref:Enhancer of polycomb-like protein n=1 Tax=Globisporangium ultimum (strain ATCC 200006 / CBS 805.95 / DAOM BR144) TaxID=431595 RepID=K3XAB4_GLOUD
MRRQSLRPRQIDVHARMRIIRSEEDLVLDEDGAGSSQPQTTFEELIGSVENKKHLATAAAHKSAKRKKNIPIPVNLTVDSYDDAVKDDFVVPTSYVRFQTIPSANEDQKVDIDLEIADLKWLKTHPKYGDDGDPRYQVSTEKLAKMLDVLEKASALINPSVVTLAEAEEVFTKQLQMAKTPLNKVTVDVYNYWVQKRLALKRPLLRKHWPQTPLNDTNPHLVFRPREKERYKLRKHRKNDMEGYRKLQQLRADCDRVRHLMDLVKRREKAKRLQIEFLDEIRRQAIYELTDRSGEVRKPKIPVEEDRHKKRKKKKKKHRKDGVDGDEYVASDSSKATTGSNDAAVAAGTQLPSSDATAVAPASAGNAPDALQSGRVPSFMEYDTSKNFRIHEDGDNGDEDELTMPHYPSYPMPLPHVMASIFIQPPKYRCRGRIGRGGRLIIDRIPVPSSRYYGPTELNATAAKFSKETSAATTVAAPPQTTPSTVGEAINSGHHHHSAILVHEASFRPLTNKIKSVTSKRLDEIYRMSDSEDELLEPLTSSVFETASMRKPSSGGTNSSKSHAAAARMTKFALDI